MTTRTLTMTSSLVSLTLYATKCSGHRLELPVFAEHNTMLPLQQVVKLWLKVYFIRWTNELTETLRASRKTNYEMLEMV